MWKQRYKKTFWLNQAIITLACWVLALHFKMPFDGIVVFILVMELGALLGSMWTARLMGKFDRQHKLLG